MIFYAFSKFTHQNYSLLPNLLTTTTKTYFTSKNEKNAFHKLYEFIIIITTITSSAFIVNLKMKRIFFVFGLCFKDFFYLVYRNKVES